MEVIKLRSSNTVSRVPVIIYNVWNVIILELPPSASAAPYNDWGVSQGERTTISEGWRFHISLLVPSGLGGGDDVGRDVRDVVLAEASAEGRHGVLPVGDLRHHRLLVPSPREVLLERGLLEGLIGHDDVLSAGVTRGAVGVEDLLPGADVSGEGGGNGDADGDRGSGDGGLDGLGVFGGGGREWGRGGERGTEEKSETQHGNRVEGDDGALPDRRPPTAAFPAAIAKTTTNLRRGPQP